MCTYLPTFVHLSTNCQNNSFQTNVFDDGPVARSPHKYGGRYLFIRDYWNLNFDRVVGDIVFFLKRYKRYCIPDALSDCNKCSHVIKQWCLRFATRTPCTPLVLFISPITRLYRVFSFFLLNSRYFWCNAFDMPTLFLKF